MSLLALMTLAGSLSAADAHADHADHLKQAELARPANATDSEERVSALLRRLSKGSGSEIFGDAFSVASDTPFPDSTGTHFHSNNSEVFSNPVDVAEVGSFGGDSEEVRGLAEFPLVQDGGTGYTLMFEVRNPLGGLFEQPPTDFEILLEAYAGNGIEEISDYSVSPLTPISAFTTGGLVDQQILEFDVSAAIGEALSAGGDLGVRLRPVTSPLGGAMTFENFTLTKLAERSSLGGSGAVFCPNGSLGKSSKGGCTAPLGNSDRFGSAISVSGNTVLIGVPGLDDTGPNGGAVYVFLKDGGQLLFQEKLLVPPEFAAAGFGTSIAVDGGVAVIGAPNELTSFRKGGATGLQAAIFERLQQGFTFRQPVTSTLSTPGSNFGQAIAMKGNMMVIGAPGRGRAAIFNFNNGFPQETGVVGPPPGGKGNGALFGRAVAMSNNKFAVAGGSPVVAGSVGIFQAVGNNLSTLGGMNSNDPNENFGASIAMDGDNIFVGAPGANFVAGQTGNRTGAVFGVGLNGGQRGRFTPPNPSAGGLFGQSLAASNGRLAVGQPGGGPGGKGTAPSRVYLFEATVDRATQVDQVVQQTGDEAGIGNSVALDGGDLLAASPDTGTLTGVLDTRTIFTDNYEVTDVSQAAQDTGSRCPAGYTRRRVMFIDDIESGGPGWVTGGTGGSFDLSTTRAASGTRSFRSTPASFASNQTLSTPLIERPALVDPDGAANGFDQLFVVSFKQYRAIEGGESICFDGGIIEIDFGNFFQILQPGFISVDPFTSDTIAASNPLSTLTDTTQSQRGVDGAWCGNSGTFVETQITSFNSSATNVRYRFRFGTDSDVPSQEGWYIDDFTAEVCDRVGGPSAAGQPAGASIDTGGLDIPVK